MRARQSPQLPTRRQHRLTTRRHYWRWMYWVLGAAVLSCPLLLLHTLPRRGSDSNGLRLTRLLPVPTTTRYFSQRFLADFNCSHATRATLEDCTSAYDALIERTGSSSPCLFVRRGMLIIPRFRGRWAATTGPWHLGGARSFVVAVRLGALFSGTVARSWSLGLTIDPDPTCEASCAVTVEPNVAGR